MIETLAPWIIGLLFAAAALTYAAFGPWSRILYGAPLLGVLTLGLSLSPLFGVPMADADAGLIGLGIVALALPIIDQVLARRGRSRREKDSANG